MINNHRTSKPSRKIFVVLCILLFPVLGHAQGIKVISKTKEHRQQVFLDSNFRMVELRSLIPALLYDLRYATTNNFLQQRLYRGGSKTYLRLPAAVALSKVEAALRQHHVKLKVYDAYRPYSVTEKMWAQIQDERYVANPAKGSGHNRGLSVDITLVDAATGNELDMGTGFDNFSDSAHHDNNRLPLQVLHNRRLLLTSMEAAGFKALATEWWHYSWPNDRNYSLLNIQFSKL